MPRQKQVVAAEVIEIPLSLFLLHPIHSSGSVMNFADLMRESGIEKNTLGGGGFSCVYMSTDTNVSISYSMGVLRARFT